MGWSMGIAIKDTDGNDQWVEVVESCTYNLTPMWSKAIPFLEVTRDFDGKICSDILADLKVGMMDIIDNPEDYIALNPDNGWGNFDCFFDAYVKLFQNVAKHPSGSLVWYG